MELRHLRYFVAVAEELHFGRAARRLHITQPPLSQQIQLLERELGVKLLIRGRKVQLTQAGRVFLEEGRRTIDVAERAARAARAAGAGEAARLRIGYPAATLTEVVPAAFRKFTERFPDVGIEGVAGHTGDLLSALRDDQLDLAFLTMNRHDREAVCSKLLYREPLGLAIPDNHQLANRAAVATSDLARLPPRAFRRPARLTTSRPEVRRTDAVPANSSGCRAPLRQDVADFRGHSTQSGSWANWAARSASLVGTGSAAVSDFPAGTASPPNILLQGMWSGWSLPITS
jgi:DNA-binding transcriptional LysR family regulator